MHARAGARVGRRRASPAGRPPLEPGGAHPGALARRSPFQATPHTRKLQEESYTMAL